MSRQNYHHCLENLEKTHEKKNQTLQPNMHIITVITAARGPFFIYKNIFPMAIVRQILILKNIYKNTNNKKLGTTGFKKNKGCFILGIIRDFLKSHL
jgi:hypothetical protein